MAKVMVIAGGDWQCPIVKTAKKMGHYVICTNLYEDSPAFKFANAGEVANVLDKERNLEIAKKYNPDVVLTDQSDIAVTTVAYVAENLGIKGIGSDTARLFTNKYAMRDFCRKNGFAYPEYYLCNTLEEALNAFRKIRKAIIKPLDSQSSRGVYIIGTEQELKEKFQDTMQYSNGEKAILVEQYIEGTEFTVDGIKTDDDYYVTAISKKAHFEYNPSVAKELLFSHYDKEFDYNELREVNRQLVLEMGLPYGLTHAEYKYMDGKFYLIEIAARGGGTRISSDIVPIMSGINTNEMLINMLLDREVKIAPSYEEHCYAVLGFFDFAPGKIRKIQGVEKAEMVEGVHALCLDLKDGDVIENAHDDRTRVGYYILKASSYEELRACEAKMKNTIHIEYER